MITINGQTAKENTLLVKDINILENLKMEKFYMVLLNIRVDQNILENLNLTNLMVKELLYFLMAQNILVNGKKDKPMDMELEHGRMEKNLHGKI